MINSEGDVSFLFPLAYEGEGTAYVESLSSFCARLAFAHGMSVQALLRVLNFVEDGQRKKKLPTARACSRSVPGTLNRNRKNSFLLELLNAALKRNDLDCLTPRILADVVMPDRMMRMGRAWCSACFQEDVTRYDRLLWGFSLIERCPIHHIALDARCPSCNAKQIRYSFINDLSTCTVCGRSLIHRANQKAMRQDPCYGERDIVELIEYSAKHPNCRYDSEGPKRFELEYRRLNKPKPEEHSRRAVAYTILGTKGTKKKRTLTVLLDLAATTGATLHQMLIEPESAAKMHNLPLRDGSERTAYFLEKSKEKLERIRKALLIELRRTDDKAMLSIEEFCVRNNVEKTRLRYWFPVLMHEFSLALSQRRRDRRMLRDMAARHWVLKEGIPGIRKGKWVSSNAAIQYLRENKSPLTTRVCYHFRQQFKEMSYEETHKLYISAKKAWGRKKPKALAQWAPRLRHKKRQKSFTKKA